MLVSDWRSLLAVRDSAWDPSNEADRPRAAISLKRVDGSRLLPTEKVHRSFSVELRQFGPFTVWERTMATVLENLETEVTYKLSEDGVGVRSQRTAMGGGIYAIAFHPLNNHAKQPGAVPGRCPSAGKASTSFGSRNASRAG